MIFIYCRQQDDSTTVHITTLYQIPTSSQLLGQSVARSVVAAKGSPSVPRVMESDGPVFNERQHQQVREDTEAGAGPEGVARGVTTRDEADESQAGTTGMEPPPTVSFIVVCHRCLPPCACHFRLNCLNERRLDLVARCAPASPPSLP